MTMTFSLDEIQSKNIQIISLSFFYLHFFIFVDVVIICLCFFKSK